MHELHYWITVESPPTHFIFRPNTFIPFSPSHFEVNFTHIFKPPCCVCHHYHWWGPLDWDQNIWFDCYIGPIQCDRLELFQENSEICYQATQKCSISESLSICTYFDLVTFFFSFLCSVLHGLHLCFFCLQVGLKQTFCIHSIGNKFLHTLCILA